MSPLQFEKHLFPTDATSEGMVILCILLHFAKALSPSNTVAFEIWKPDSSVHPSNASFSIILI